MKLVDTSALVDALTGQHHSAPDLLELLAQGDVIALPSLVLFEWLRGPRSPSELKHQERLFPLNEVVPFGTEEADLAAQLYRLVKRARGREMDIGIAATAIRQQAQLWTLNEADFADIPGLSLWRPSRS
ncbi:MAG: type II toxin-antitoxin system VapC family toxin [Acidobacteriota bacterium]